MFLLYRLQKFYLFLLIKSRLFLMNKALFLFLQEILSNMHQVCNFYPLLQIENLQLYIYV